MAKPTPKSRASRRARARSRSRVHRPSPPFWSELLATVESLRAQVKRLADAEGLAPAVTERHLDWGRFTESREAAAEGRERYWREVGPAAAAK